MIKNDRCPYCTLPLNRGKAENHPRGASVEHLIPNTVLKIKRSKRDGEFLACRSCNAKKSKLDEVFGTVGKIQSKDESFVIESINRALDKNNSKRFVDMVVSARETHGGDVLITLPMDIDEIAAYCTYLAKGAYFLDHGQPLKLSKNIVLFDIFSNLYTREIEQAYYRAHGSSAFDDLRENPNSTVYADGQFLLHKKDGSYMFVVHDCFVVFLHIVPRTLSNIRKRQECYKQFS